MAYYDRANLTGFEQQTDSFLDIFSEFDFVVDDGLCNFFCPNCRYTHECAVYQQIKHVWENFYM